MLPPFLPLRLINNHTQIFQDSLSSSIPKNAEINILESYVFLNFVQEYRTLNVACNTNMLLWEVLLHDPVGHWVKCFFFFFNIMKQNMEVAEISIRNNTAFSLSFLYANGQVKCLL